MSDRPSDVAALEAVYRREKALADFGTFAFRETELQPILDEAARVCAASLGVTFSKICKFQPSQNDLLVVAGHGWEPGVVGFAISVADETSPQGRAFTTGAPQLCPDIGAANLTTCPPSTRTTASYRPWMFWLQPKPGRRLAFLRLIAR